MLRADIAGQIGLTTMVVCQTGESVVLTNPAGSVQAANPATIVATGYCMKAWVTRTRFRAALLCGLALLSVGARQAPAQTAAVFGGATSTLGSGFNRPGGLAVDSSGNVYVADSGNSAVKEIEAVGGIIPASPTIRTLGSGFGQPISVAVDGHGNVYVADLGNTAAVYEIEAVGGVIPASPTILPLGSGFSAPEGVAVDGSGNVYVADPGNNAVYEIEAVSGAIPASPTIRKLGSGFSTPRGVAIDGSGNIYVADTGNNAVREIEAVGGAIPASPTILALGSGFSAPQGVAVDGSGNVYVGDSSHSAVKEIMAVSGVVSSASTVNIVGSGFSYPWGVAVDGSGSVYVADYDSNSVKDIQRSSVKFGSAAVAATTPATETLTFTFTTGVTIGTPVVMTQGAPNLDFTDAGTGTCTTTNGNTYLQGDTCTVDVKFTPMRPGMRLGAVQLISSGGAIIATANVYGLGIGPLVTFPSNTIVSTIGSGFFNPTSVAVDASGDVFVADATSNEVNEIFAGSSTVVMVSKGSSNPHGGFNNPSGLAVDGGGNVLVADRNNKAVEEIVAGTGTAASGTVNSNSTVNTVGSGFIDPAGVAVDEVGNVFVADGLGNKVREIIAGTGGAASGKVNSSSTVITLGNGFTDPGGVAVDASGNVFVADYTNNAVKEIAAGTGGAASGTVNSSSTVNTVGSRIGHPAGVAVDASGNVFVADYGNAALEIVAGTGGAAIGTVNSSSTVKTLASGFTNTTGVAVDASGNVFVADYGTGTYNAALGSVTEIDLSDALSLTFASTLDGATGTAQTVTMANTGNAPLTFPIPTTGSDPSVANYFTLNSSGGTACPQLTTGSQSTATLAQNATCTLAISFAPTNPASGTINGSLILTDNNLNAAAATQNISLNGSSTLPAPTATQAIAETTQSVNQATNFTPVTGSGGTGTLTYSVSPTIPAGLSFSSATGAITGTPSALSSATTYTVTVKDADSLAATATFSLTVNALAATLGVTGSPSSSTSVNTAVTFTAQLAGVPLTPVVPSGTITFQINGSSSPACPARTVNTSGSATCTTSLLVASSDSITASYSGDSNFVVPSAGTATQTVSALAVTLGVAASPSSFTMVNDSVTFTAQLAGVSLTPVVPSGKVNFTASGSTISGCGAVSVSAGGQATCATSSLAAGSDPITAIYSGDSNFTVASAGAASQNVTATTSTTAAPASLNYSPGSQAASLSAAVISGSGTVNVGTVTFSVFNGATQIGAATTSGTVTGGAASVIYTLPGGTVARAYSIQAVYNASAPFATSNDNAHSLTVGKATAAVALSSLSQTYAGSALAATASTVPNGLTVTFTYNGSATPPTAAGSYTVTGTVSDSNYTGTTSGTMVIGMATAAVTLSSLSQTYSGSALAATASTAPSGLTVALTYNGSSTAPTTAGSYTVVGTIGDSNYTGTATGTMVIGKATAAVALGSLSQTYAGSALAATASTVPNGLTVTFTYNGSATPPTAAGSYTVAGTVSDSNYTGTATGTMVIGKATAAVTLSLLSQTYAGSALAATASTVPNGLTVTFTYNGSATPPTAAGSYPVVGTINDSNYTGTATGTMVIGKATAAVALASSANPALTGPMMLAAAISSIVGTPTGTVSFMDSLSTIPLGQGTVSGGVATLSISSLAMGSHSITAVYSGDTNFAGVASGILLQSILDFSLNPNTGSGGSGTITSQTVMPGGTATYALVIAPTTGTTLPRLTILTIAGLPAGATALITPSSWSQLTSTSWSFPANTPLTDIALTVGLPSAMATAYPTDGMGCRFVPLSLALLLLPFAGKMRRAGKRIGRTISLLLSLAIGAAAMTGLSGCGSANGFFGQPPKTYTINITVTAGTVSHSTNVNLTVL
jgi:large repetitive protein